MHIAVLHNFYRSESPSGENEVVQQQVEALLQRGHRVSLVRRDSDVDTAGPVAKARTAWNVAAGRGSDPTAELDRLSPDVVHVHNLFPTFGMHWLARTDLPIVATLHNYRPMCANGLLLRDGGICTLCPDGDRWAGLRHACYRESRVATAPLSWRLRRGAAADPLLHRADAVITLSDTSERMYRRAGVQRIRMIPNGVPDPGPVRPGPGTPGWVFVGRLMAEKGLADLLQAWPAGMRLDVIGDGPLRAALARMAPAGVRFLGQMQRAEVLARLPSYAGLVHPGIALEGAYPLTIVEAWAAGLPVLARTGGGAEAMLRRWPAGALWSGGPDLVASLAAAGDVDRRLPRSVYEQNFSVQAWLTALEATYHDVMAQRRRH